MSRSARVGIGLPVYNGENYLCAAIESVLAQTFTDIALIISDNASTDGTREICLGYARADHRVQYHRSDVNRGLLWNFNQVFRLCTSEYFMWFSHDDALEPGYVERCVLILDADPTAVLSFSACRDIDGEGQTIGVRRSTVAMDSSDPIARFREGIRLEHLCEPWCGLTRSDAIRRTPLFGSYADYDRVMIAELGLRGRLIEIPAPLFVNREHAKRAHLLHADRFERTRWIDPGTADAIVLPHFRELRGLWGAVKRAELVWDQRAACYRELLFWALRYRGRLANDLKVVVRETLRSVLTRLRMHDAR